MSTSSVPVRHVLIGGYTPDVGTAVGVRSLLNTSRGAGNIKLDARATLPLPSPTYLIGHPSRPWVFAVSEISPGTVSSLQVAADGQLRRLSTVPSGGDKGCHLALSPDGRFVLVAHYGGGIASFAVRTDGTLSDRVAELSFSGTGPDTERQEASHPHQIVVDGEELLVCDLGADRVHRVEFEPVEGGLSAGEESIKLPGGSGPRHLVLVEDFVIVACELSGELWFARREEDGWRELRSMRSSSSGAGLVQPSAIVAEGSRIFVANRGPDTVSVFDVETATERLTRVTEFDCGGAWPRDLLLRDGLLWVSNERSDSIAVFQISPLPQSATTEFASPTPSRVLLLPEPGSPS